jgi:hypothetical protein
LLGRRQRPRQGRPKSRLPSVVSGPVDEDSRNGKVSDRSGGLHERGPIRAWRPVGPRSGGKQCVSSHCSLLRSVQSRLRLWVLVRRSLARSRVTASRPLAQHMQTRSAPSRGGMMESRRRGGLPPTSRAGGRSPRQGGRHSPRRGPTLAWHAMATSTHTRRRLSSRRPAPDKQLVGCGRRAVPDLGAGCGEHDPCNGIGAERTSGNVGRALVPRPLWQGTDRGEGLSARPVRPGRARPRSRPRSSRRSLRGRARVSRNYCVAGCALWAAAGGRRWGFRPWHLSPPGANSSLPGPSLQEPASACAP